MTPGEKDAALQKYRALLLATFDYLLDLHGGCFVVDGEDHIGDYYRQQKLQTEKYYARRRLDPLQKRFATLARSMQNRVDLNFAGYIKEKTGYDIDLFEDLRKRVDIITAQNEIRSQEELNDICNMLDFHEQAATPGEASGKLRVLLDRFGENRGPAAFKRKRGYVEAVSRVEKDGIEEVSMVFTTGPKPRHSKVEESSSPDGKRKLRIARYSEGSHDFTTVVVDFPAASGAIYGTDGIHPDVKAWWKDNATIVIETKKEYLPISQHRQIRSFNDVVSIEYVER